MRHDPESEAKFIDYVCAARAMENEICMVFCNSAADDVHRPFGTMAGGTQVTVPFKGPVAHTKSNKEEMIVTDVDVAQLVADAETCYKVRQDWRAGKVFGGMRSYEVETLVSGQKQ